MYKIIGDDQKEYGPVAAAQIHEWIVQGRANGRTLVLPEGGTDWRPLASLPEFYAALNPAPPPGAGAPQMPAGGMAPAASAHPMAPRRPQTNVLAVTGLVMGILSLMFSWLCCCWPIFSPLGIVFSSIALSQINKRPHEQTGRGMALAGLILSVVGVLIAILLIIIYGLMGASSHALDEFRR